MSSMYLLFRLACIILPLIIRLNFSAQGQNVSRINPEDSIKIKETVEGFYFWYCNTIRNGKMDVELYPLFVKGKDGMTTLDFAKYRDGLKRHRLTRDFIDRKVNGFQSCLDHLKQIPFYTFLQLESLSQFEEIGCDFGNIFEWSGGMEPVDGAELKKINRINKKTVQTTVWFYRKDNNGTKQYDNSAALDLIKIKNKWQIDNFSLDPH